MLVANCLNADEPPREVPIRVWVGLTPEDLMVLMLHRKLAAKQPGLDFEIELHDTDRQLERTLREHSSIPIKLLAPDGPPRTKRTEPLDPDDARAALDAVGKMFAEFMPTGSLVFFVCLRNGTDPERERQGHFTHNVTEKEDEIYYWSRLIEALKGRLHVVSKS